MKRRRAYNGKDFGAVIVLDDDHVEVQLTLPDAERAHAWFAELDSQLYGYWMSHVHAPKEPT
jgi:hypothetical protein